MNYCITFQIIQLFNYYIYVLVPPKVVYGEIYTIITLFDIQSIMINFHHLIPLIKSDICYPTSDIKSIALYIRSDHLLRQSVPTLKLTGVIIIFIVLIK